MSRLSNGDKLEQREEKTNNEVSYQIKQSPPVPTPMSTFPVRKKSIPPQPPVTQPPSPQTRRIKCSMMSIFLITSFIQVAIACVFVWLVGYFSALSMADDLTGQLRASFMSHSVAAVEALLDSPLLAANDLKLAMLQRFPDLETRLRVDDANGYLATVTYVAARWPVLGTFSVFNQYGLQISMSTPQLFAELYSVESSKIDAVAIGYPNSTSDHSIDVNVYIPTRIHSFAAYDPPFVLPFDILPTDTPADIARYLGPINTTYHGVNNANSLAWRSGLEIFAEKVEGAYLQPFQSESILHDASYLSLSACSVFPDPTSGKLGIVVIAGVAMGHLTQFLSTLPLGNSGQAFLVQTNGAIIAASDVALSNLVAVSQRGVMMQQSDDELLQRISQQLYEWNFITVAGWNESETRLTMSPFNLRRDNTVYQAKLNFRGSVWHVQSKALNASSVGLPFALVIATRDDDFNSAVRTNIATSAWLAAVILVLAVSLSGLLAVITTKPLIRVISFMALASDIVRNPNQQEHRDQLAELRHEWSKTSTCASETEFDDELTEETDKGFIDGIENVELQIVSTRQTPSPPPLPVSTDALPSAGLAEPPIVPHAQLPAPANTDPDPSPVVVKINDGGRTVLVSTDPQAVTEHIHSSGPAACIRRCCRTYLKCLQVQEVSSLQKSFGFMLASLASIDTLELVNEAKKSFIRYIFHEVRVPFSAMVLGIEQLKTDLAIGSYPQSVYETIEILQEQGEVVTRILNDVLSMQKIESNQQQLELHHFSMSHLVKSTIHTFRNPAEDKRIQMVLNLGDLDSQMNALVFAQPAILPPEISSLLPFGRVNHQLGQITRVLVQADPYRLRQVISNFISNAIKFTQKSGKVSVRLMWTEFQSNLVKPATKSDTEGNGEAIQEPFALNGTEIIKESAAVVPIGSIMIYVSVADTGIGISSEDAKNLFQPYRQIASAHQKGRGTGLGLSIAKSIVRLHGGVIGVKAAPGKGSEFFFRMRLPVAAVTETRYMSQSMSSSGDHTFRLGQGDTPQPNGTSPLAVADNGTGSRNLPSKSHSSYHEPQFLTPTILNDEILTFNTSTVTLTPMPPQMTREVSESRSMARPVQLHIEMNSAKPSRSPSIALAWPVPDAQPAAVEEAPAIAVKFHDEEPELVSTVENPSSSPLVSQGSTMDKSRDLDPLKSETPVDASNVNITNNSSSSSSTSSSSNSNTSVGNSRPIVPVLPPSKGLGIRIPSHSNSTTTSSSLPPLAKHRSASSLTLTLSGGSVPTTPQPLSAGLKSPALSLNGMRILVAEDSMPNRRLLLKLLESMNCTAVGVEDGEECCKAILGNNGSVGSVTPPGFSHNFDCIIMDGCMPVMDGLEATRRLRQHHIKMPILGLTGHALAEDVRAFLAAGANAVYTKPISRAQLYEVILQHTSSYSPMEGKSQLKQ